MFSEARASLSPRPGFAFESRSTPKTELGENRGRPTRTAGSVDRTLFQSFASPRPVRSPNMQASSFLQSHILHFYRLAALDFVDIRVILKCTGDNRTLRELRAWAGSGPRPRCGLDRQAVRAVAGRVGRRRSPRTGFHLAADRSGFRIDQGAAGSAGALDRHRRVQDQPVPMRRSDDVELLAARRRGRAGACGKSTGRNSDREPQPTHRSRASRSIVRPLHGLCRSLTSRTNRELRKDLR